VVVAPNKLPAFKAERWVNSAPLTAELLRAIDNQFAIWRALDNDAWPAKYLFDRQGRLIERWVGEGSYDEIESAIRRALAAADPDVRLPPVSREATVFARTGQPSYAGINSETYLGG
jgi:hypothetical protein